MKNKIKSAAGRMAATSLLAVVALGAGTVQANGIVASATGHYEATYYSSALGGDATRTVSFTAMRDSDNNTRGQVQFHNMDTGVKMHLTVDCLHVDGNVATISGQFSHQDAAYFEEVFLPYFWVRVIDNGEGEGAVDAASPFVSADTPLPCTSTVFDWVFPNEAGNIQVRER